jgi:hypothetical protein
MLELAASALTLDSDKHSAFGYLGPQHWEDLPVFMVATMATASVLASIEPNRAA